MKKAEIKQDPIAEAKKLIEAEKQKNLKAFMQELEALQQKYGCTIGSQVTIGTI
jgi:hypothetical protein